MSRYDPNWVWDEARQNYYRAELKNGQGPVYRRPSSTSAGGNPYSQNPAQSGSRSITSQAVPNAASAGGSVYSQSPRHGAHHSVPLRKVSTFANDGNNRISQVQPSAVSGVRGGKQISLGAEAGKTNYINTATQIDEQEMQSIYADNKLRMRGSEGPFEHLDPSFQVIKNQDEWTFFANGRVFSMLMWQAGGNAGGGPSVMRFGQEAFAKIYRFIVVQPRCKQHYSKCIRISTHGGQGVTKKGLNQKEHCIVYTGRVAPKPLPGESKMKKDPIEMEPVNSSEKLDLLSRVDLAKTYPVEHNVRVKEVGMVSKVHLKRLLAYVRDCQ
ncbi:hypothetical protein MMC13_001665 [Lambiella insularis]|nr:hypothetical protein [Lambiella insularis]